MIYIIGLGPNDSSNIKENIKQLLLDNTNAKIIARTKEHPAISFLEENNITFESCDRFYTESENFENIFTLHITCIVKNLMFYSYQTTFENCIFLEFYNIFYLYFIII